MGTDSQQDKTIFNEEDEKFWRMHGNDGWGMRTFSPYNCNRSGAGVLFLSGRKRAREASETPCLGTHSGRQPSKGIWKLHSGFRASLRVAGGEGVEEGTVTTHYNDKNCVGKKSEP